MTTVAGVDDNRKESASLIEMSHYFVRLIGNGVVTDDVCRRIYQTYVKLAKTNPNVVINVAQLKARGNGCENGQELLIESSPADGEPVKVHRNVVLGGTFDRLHIGHKILLTEAVVRCGEKLTVGVTDHNMIQGKKLWELIEPVHVRMANVLDFLKQVDGQLIYDVVAISDMFGPTQTDPDLDLLVVSAETEKGGLKVNQVRETKGMKPLGLHVVQLVDGEVTGEADEMKVSSSNLRLKLLGTRLRPPMMRNELPRRPYLIGLTGGIASGKSTIGKKLESFGAGLVDCDKIAHGCYRKGSRCFREVVGNFGQAVVSSVDGEIDRRALANIVFNSKEELDKLNRILWPEIIKESLREAQKIYERDRKDVIVLEAAVLLRAGWQQYVHEVWACIIPPDEAVTRVVRRNGITEDAARARLAAQPTNCEQVAAANVVFYSLYSYDFTGMQVKRAWDDLLAYLAIFTKL